MASITLLFIINFLVQVCTISAVTLPKFSAILIFGDSLLDSGNNNFIPTPFKANHPPYGRDFPGGIATGRFSNGLMISDLLASELGIKDLVPPFLDPKLSGDDIRTGVCFASAGSGFDNTTNEAFNIMPLSKQLELLKSYVQKLQGVVGEEEARKIINSSLVVLSSGSNDLGFSRNSQFPRDDYLLQKLQEFVKEVYGAGIRYMLLAGLPALGCFPATTGGGVTCLEMVNSYCSTYNKKLQSFLPQTQASLPGSKLVYGDMYTPVGEMANNPAAFGLLVTNRGCCGNGLEICSQGMQTCPNASQYMFFDTFHPTETVYRHIFQYWVNNSIPQFS